MKRKHKKSIKGLQQSTSTSSTPTLSLPLSTSTVSENQSTSEPGPGGTTPSALSISSQLLNISFSGGTSNSSCSSSSNCSSSNTTLEHFDPRKIKVDTKSHLGIFEYDSETDLTTVCTNALAAGDTSLHFNVTDCREHILETLIDTGMIAVMKKYISHRLRFSGWTTTVNEECIEYMKEKGLDNVNVSHMMCDVVPLAKELVPADVRSEIQDILKSFAVAHITIDDTIETPTEDFEMDTCGIDLPFEYQPRDTKPNPGNGLIFTQPFPSTPGSPTYSMHSPPPHMYSPPHSHSPLHPSSGSSSFSNLPQHSPKDSGQGIGSPYGGVVLLDRLLDKEIEHKEPPKEKIVIVIPKEQEKPAVIQREPVPSTATSTPTSTSSTTEVNPKDHQHHHAHPHSHTHAHHHMRNKRLDKEERDKKEREEQRLLYQQLSKPTSPITPIISTSSLRSGDKKLLIETVVPIPSKPAPITPAALLSSSSTVTSTNVGVTSNPIPPTKHVKPVRNIQMCILNSDNDDDDEDDDELLDI